MWNEQEGLEDAGYIGDPITTLHIMRHVMRVRSHTFITNKPFT